MPDPAIDGLYVARPGRRLLSLSGGFRVGERGSGAEGRGRPERGEGVYGLGGLLVEPREGLRAN